MIRRDFLRVTALGTAGSSLSVVPGLFSNKIIEEWDPQKPLTVPGNELTVQPVLMYSIQARREQTSWRFAARRIGVKWDSVI